MVDCSVFVIGMNETEVSLLQALEELTDAIRNLPNLDPKPNLISYFERIDALSSQLPASTSPTLRHYLQQKSYEKALLFLQGNDALNTRGNCHGHRN